MMPSIVYKAFSFLPFGGNGIGHPIKLTVEKIDSMDGKLWEKFRESLNDYRHPVKYWLASTRESGGEWCHDHFEWKQVTGNFAYQWTRYYRDGGSRPIGEPKIGKMVYTRYEKHKCGLVELFPELLSYRTLKADRHISRLDFFSKQGLLLRRMNEEEFILAGGRRVFSSSIDEIARDYKIV